jgi:hypothetical protein
MKLFPILFLAGLLLHPTQAARRVGEAQVRADANGQPCFTISDDEERRSGSPDFQAITVSEGQRTLWRMSMPRERTFPMSAGMCIPYGGRVSSLPQTPAASLQDGAVYTVSLETRSVRKPTTPLRYQAHFCLTRQQGGVGVRQVDAKAGAGRAPDGCPPRRGQALAQK